VDRLLAPHKLARGATLGIAAPGGPVDAARLERGVEKLRAAGFRVRHRADITSHRGYLAGDDARRAAELIELWSDPGVDAIVCARGGYGCARILSRLDAGQVRAARKPLVGYSDVTALLLWQARCAGLAGFHGPMLDRPDDLDPESLGALVELWCGERELPYVLRGVGRRGARAEGRLVGGSLTLLAASIGTAWALDCRGAILVLEEIGERPYRIDRMLQQLLAARALDGVVGVAVGSLTGCSDERFPEPSALDVICEVLAKLRVPIVAELPIGHAARNHPWPVGAGAVLDGDRGELRILERGVELL
jgi:muramoyltetrapeptide carboxypeptidase